MSSEKAKLHAVVAAMGISKLHLSMHIKPHD